MFERDVNACRYVDGERESMNSEGKFLPKHVDNLFSKRATLQVRWDARSYADAVVMASRY